MASGCSRRSRPARADAMTSLRRLALFLAGAVLFLPTLAVGVVVLVLWGGWSLVFRLDGHSLRMFCEASVLAWAMRRWVALSRADHAMRSRQARREAPVGWWAQSGSGRN